MALSPVTPEVSLVTRVVKTLLSWVGIRDAEQQMRENASNWLELGDKVYHYRRDVLPATQVAELQSHLNGLRAACKARQNAANLKLEIEALEEVLRRTGGAIYPKTALVENVEFFLVAAIVILGIRTYFIQPFKIPTNSMWPTYYGMTSEVFPTPADEPSAIKSAARVAAFGAWPHRLDAPTDGEILVPIRSGGRGMVYSRFVPGRTWLVIPTTLREYTLLVDDQPVKVKLPIDFDFDWTVSEAFFPLKGNFNIGKFAQEVDRLLKDHQFVDRKVNGETVRCLRTGRKVRKGERVLAFDEMTGDQLFVDRVSYHFVRPQVGQGFVFRTGGIMSDDMRERDTGQQIDQYYIKRLVGTPGDTLEIKSSTLFRNGEPITGASAFEGNARLLGKYSGYQAMGRLSPGNKLSVGPKQFFAMGDNSPSSLDSRYWGFVPAKDVAGRPLFIYYPFTKRWGPAR
jgi:signal peptidase I